MNRREHRGDTLWRLLYTSRSTLGGTPAEQRAAAQDIANKSAQRNKAAGLTGTLLFIDNGFTQVLEGPSEQLERVFEQICRDFRHEDVKLIDCSEIRTRLFAGWDMAVLTDDEETTIPLRDDLQEIRFLVGVNADEALRQMRELLNRQEKAEQPPRAA